MTERRVPQVPGWIARSAQPKVATGRTVPGVRVVSQSNSPSALNPVRVAAAPVGVGLDSSTVRARMAQRIGASGVSNAAVLQAMATVERHRFVDSALVNQAYEDTACR